MRKHDVEKGRRMKKMKTSTMLRARSWAATGCQLLWIRWFSFIYVRLFLLRSFVRSATNRFFQRVSVWFRFFLRKWSFLGIVRNLYLINILRVVILMIRSSMAAPRGGRLPIFVCKTKDFRILSICTWNLSSKIWAYLCFRMRIQFWISGASFTNLVGLCYSELPLRLLLRGGDFGLLVGYCREHIITLISILGWCVS